MISLSLISYSASEIAQPLLRPWRVGWRPLKASGIFLAYEINLALAADESQGPGSMSPEGLIGPKQVPPSYIDFEIVEHLNLDL